MLSSQEKDQAIEAQTFPRVTKEAMEQRIKTSEFIVLPGSTVTVCHMTLDNGYSVRGESACVDKRNFNLAIGEKLAYDDAFRKLWPLFGFLLAESIYRKAA